MPFPFKISLVGLGVASMQVTLSTAWDYTDTDWITEGECASTNPNQSPIDIVVATVADGSAQTPAQPWNFQWEGFPDSATESAIEGALVTNNHTWEVEWDTADAATDKYGMVVGDKLYRLREFHYHSPSEHTVDGNHYDMEAQHVHFCEGISCVTPDPDDEILVVSVFLKVGQPNAYLQSFWNQFSQETDPSISNLANPYTNFMPEDKSYYSYVGSTTTPPCAQNVQWRLMQQYVEMSQEQLTDYHTSINALDRPAIPSVPPQGVGSDWAVTTTKTNNRPAQLLGDRTVLHFVMPVTDQQSELARSLLVPALVALTAALLLFAGVCLCLRAQNKQTPQGKRGVKPRPSPAPPKEAAPKEETVPLMPPPLLAAPNLSMVVPAQPLMQAVPQAYTTAARPVAVAPYGQGSVVLQP